MLSIECKRNEIVSMVRSCPLAGLPPYKTGSFNPLTLSS